METNAIVKRLFEILTYDSEGEDEDTDEEGAEEEEEPKRKPGSSKLKPSNVVPKKKKKARNEEESPETKVTPPQTHASQYTSSPQPPAHQTFSPEMSPMSTPSVRNTPPIDQGGAHSQQGILQQQAGYLQQRTSSGYFPAYTTVRLTRAHRAEFRVWADRELQHFLAIPARFYVELYFNDVIPWICGQRKQCPEYG